MADVADLTLEQTVGQLFQVGFRGTEATGTIRELIEAYHVGGVVYFDRNLETAGQVAALSASLQELAEDASGIPLFVSVDQEGGRVTRLPFGPRPPSAMAVGATGDPARARDLAAAVGDQLRAVGINANLAPVVDANTNPQNPVIGTRSFGSDPQRVDGFGAAVASGLQGRGVVACAKHFPGHGDTETDSHHELPVVDHDHERLNRMELVPFRRAIAAGVDAVMTAHVAVPAVEPDERVPATLSRAVTTGLLREELGFDGLIVTDCMEMDAVAAGVGTVEGAVRAVAAGADALFVSHSPDRQRAAIEAVVDAVRDGAIPESRVDAAARRVLALKERRIAGERSPDVERATTAVERASRRVAREAVTVVRDRGDALPLDVSAVSLLSFGSGDRPPVDRDEGGVRPLADRLEASGYDVHVHGLGPDDGLPALDGGVALAVTRNAAAEAWQAAAVHRALDRSDQVVVLAVRTPYDAGAIRAPTVLATYGDSAALLAAAGDVLAGAREAGGSVPVTLQ